MTIAVAPLRRLAARTAAALLPVAAVALFAPAAFGHAAFLESQPAAGARIEESPRQITLQFSEPLIPKLTRASLIQVAGGRRLPASVGVVEGRRLVVRPRATLRRGAYRIEWHTVSPEDGHALEGSVGFGVRAAAASGQSLEQSPLERGGWLRIAFRALFYIGLLFLAGGVLNAILLTPARGLGEWLLPGSGDAGAERLAARTIDGGWLALSAGVVTVVLDGVDAGGALSLRAFDQFIFSNAAGIARFITLLALLTAVVLAGRRPRIAAGALLVAFAGIALSGHSNSADARSLALVTVWIHLVAGAVWLGGIAQIALAWWRPPGPRTERVAVMRHVLGRFGRVALPAFLLVAGTGLVNAVIQLGDLSALWASDYGRALAVKVALVGVIACASYVHALRLRPRLLADGGVDVGRDRVERRHWRLLRSEALVGGGVIAVAALLVTFPLPPRQLGAAEGAERAGAGACDPCPQPEVRRDELAVAEQGGGHIVAVWIRRSGSGSAGTVRVLGRKARPSAVPVRLAGLEQRACGRGCWSFSSPERPATLRVHVGERGQTRRATIPVAWEPEENARAARLLRRAEETMRALRSLRQEETVTSGPGTFARTSYRLRAPNRMAFVTDRNVRTVIIGRRDWYRAPGMEWQTGTERRPMPFRTRSWFRWTPFEDSARLLGRRIVRGRRVAEVAVFDRGTPVWYRLTIDVRTRRVLRVRMIAASHFMWQRFHAFNQPTTIGPPT